MVLNKKIIFISTVPLALKPIEKIIGKLKDKNNIILITNTSDPENEFLEILPKDVQIINSSMKRDINILNDLKTLSLLLYYLWREKPNMVFTISPKAGLLGILASKIMLVPIRIHAYTGQVWQTKNGLQRHLLRFLDKIIYVFSSKVLIDSASQKDFLISNNVIKEKKSNVLGNGSISGVDFDRFFPNADERQKLRNNNNISNEDIVFLFAGRINKDKGIIELIKSFNNVHEGCKNTFLWLLGHPEIEINKLKELINDEAVNSIRFFPYSNSPESFMAAADIFCLPSYREGFGAAVIESAACGIPTIGTKIYGLTDAIIDGETGILVEVQDINSLTEAMLTLVKNKEMRFKLGNQAMLRAKKVFNQEVVISKILNFLEAELE